MKKKILIIDDHEDITRILSRQLQERGFDAESTTDGRSAITMIRRHLPDLVILDIMIPDVDGTEIAARLKADPSTAEIPIIFLSALQTKQNEGEGNHGSGNVIMAKPYDINRLVQEIHKLTL